MLGWEKTSFHLIQIESLIARKVGAHNLTRSLHQENQQCANLRGHFNFQSKYTYLIYPCGKAVSFSVRDRDINRYTGYIGLCRISLTPWGYWGWGSSSGVVTLAATAIKLVTLTHMATDL